MLVDFLAFGCPTRCVLHAEVFTDATAKQAITTGFVPSRGDYVSPERAFMQRYAVKVFPSVMVLVLVVDGQLVRRVPLTLIPPRWQHRFADRRADQRGS